MTKTNFTVFITAFLMFAVFQLVNGEVFLMPFDYNF
jgi:hypothetical protein